MKETRFFYVPGAADAIELPVDEATHATRVLRLKGGDEIFLMDGEGHFFRAEVTVASSKHCMYDIKEVIDKEKDWQRRIHLAIAPTKMTDRVEWMAEKITEIGFDELTFLNCAFSERKSIRTDRMERIVVSAMKQSRKPWKPIVNPLTTFGDFVNLPITGRKYIAHCYNEIERHDLWEHINMSGTDEDITIMIGPEGDFSIDEVRMAIDHGFVSVSLGKSRLRTETAGLTAVAMAQLLLRI
ncbi:MAG: 16S rRNA (uracil(1498)-N(3))-methyltransferase [Prevotella sp.]